jgi:hypothetical protein
LRKWAESDGVAERRSVRVIFREDGIAADVQDLPDYHWLVFNHKQELSSLAEVDLCIKPFLQRGVMKPPQLSDAEGKPIITPTYETIRSYLLEDLISALSETIWNSGGLTPTDEQLLSTFAEYKKAWSATEDQWDVIVPLRNFTSAVVPVKLGRFDLRPLLPEERNIVAGGHYIAPVGISLAELAHTRFALRSAYAHVPSNFAEQNTVRRAAERVLTALRLAKVGDLGVISFFQRQLNKKPGGVSTYDPFPEFSSKRWGEAYELREEDVPAILTILAVLDRGEVEARLRPLEVALRRFNQGYGRTYPEDRIIDCVVALESCLLPDKGEELGLRFALRGLTLLAKKRDPEEARALLDGMYDARSQIVHAGKQLHTMKLRALDRAKISPLDLPKQCEAILREVLQELLPRVAYGESLRVITEELDRKLIRAITK